MGPARSAAKAPAPMHTNTLGSWTASSRQRPEKAHWRPPGRGSRVDPLESLRVALEALSANKLRSGLTMLGIVIGVGAVIALMSIGSGAQAAIANNIKSLGANLITITPGAVSQGGVSQGAGSAPTLTLNDATQISANATDVAAVSPE